MSPEIEQLVRKSLTVRSIRETHTYVSGIIQDAPALKAIFLLSAAIGRGDFRRSRPLSTAEAGIEVSARLGSDALLKRQLQTGQHFICDPAAFHAACASVGLAA